MASALRLTIVILVAATLVAVISARNSPVIFIPGKGGSQIEARLNKEANEDMPNCETLKPWHRIWLDVWYFLWPGKQFTVSGIPL